MPNVFPSYFQHFLAEKKYFSNIGLCHILGTIIFHQCANFHEKNIKYTVQEIQEISFFLKYELIPLISLLGHLETSTWGK